MKVHYFFLHLWAILALQVPDQNPATQINADPDPQPWNQHTLACRWATKACRRWRGRAGRRRAGLRRVHARRSWRTGWAASGTWRGSPMRRDTGTGPGTRISGTVQCCGSGMIFSWSGSYFSVGFGSYMNFFNYSWFKFYLCIPALLGCSLWRDICKLFRGIFLGQKEINIFKLSICVEKLSNFIRFSE